MTNHDGRHWFKGEVVERDVDSGVIETEPGRRFRFTNGCLCRNRTYAENTQVGNTVYFGMRHEGIAEIVSWSPPSGLTGDEVLRQHIATAVQSMADRIDADVLARHIGA